VGPEALPPNTTETCRLHYSNCTCCPAADCACSAPLGSVGGQNISIAATTSWDFSALDIQVASLQGSTAFPETNILQITGNTPPVRRLPHVLLTFCSYLAICSFCSLHSLSFCSRFAQILLTLGGMQWWFWAPGLDHKEFADPSGGNVGHYFSRILDWYSDNYASFIIIISCCEHYQYPLSTKTAEIPHDC